ncbi:AAA family ATPase [Paenibacillus mucilaginosus]|uniref:Response regulator receiver protein n=2 Tax=Paenibacillus mucilaginosus TaxID=61624 RepID=H6NHQ3_9BACL|nr:AAA family ATPase [Paenibacillus mucilaginosus]AEI41602.1 response regulator receiver protein [Paenibacillus mucilaginosus KNP414]AFC30124.1 response regulator receiver protein [Paenibacillus mucilaginosus 3016]MCG7215371.1 P-loop NTPase [Paenibacillus mucilaginosus]WDM30594.1 P-loop NTPase [Paenibacillus mucilaginosus]WFA18775.1 MinD/ParA family protein [Paenibacillus mucilaginosus]
MEQRDNGPGADQAPVTKRGEIIAVAGAKGGIGRTVMTVNLAAALAKNTRLQVAVLDGDLQFGDVGLAMDLQPTFTIKDVAEGIATMDGFTLSSYLSRHGSGVRVMAAPERPEQADLVTPHAVERIALMLAAQHDYLLVDTGVGLQEQTLQFIEKADQVFVLTTLEMVAIKNTKLMLETMEMLGLRDKVQVVVNRATMESVIKAGDVPDILGVETAYYVPNDFGMVSQSLNLGIPFVLNQTKSELAKAVYKMAEQLIARREISHFKPKPQSLLQSLLQKTKGPASFF